MTAPEQPRSRRSVLAGTATAISGTLAGCQLSAPLEEPSVSILAAGSLNNALENGLSRAVEPPLQVESHGSLRAARLVAGKQKMPDIVSLADVSLFESPVETPWHVEFATNSVVLAYNEDTDGGRRVSAADPNEWYRPLVEGSVRLGRTDPALDPLGYRTLFVLDLATDYYDTGVDLRRTVLEREQIYPETQLISQFETGAIDAAVAYRSMAVDRGYEYIPLPPEIDLSAPEYADRYAQVTYSPPDGGAIRGAPIKYGAFVPAGSRTTRVVDVFHEHVSGEYLGEFGFTVPPNYPVNTGNVPNEIEH